MLLLDQMEVASPLSFDSSLVKKYQTKELQQLLVKMLHLLTLNKIKLMLLTLTSLSARPYKKHLAIKATMNSAPFLESFSSRVILLRKRSISSLVEKRHA